MFDDNNSNTPPADTSQSAATPAAPVETDPRAVMESIIAEHGQGDGEQADAASAPQPTPVEPEAPSEPLEQADHYDDSMTDVERDLVGLMETDRQRAYEYGAAMLNQMPDLIAANADYVISVLSQ